MTQQLTEEQRTIRNAVEFRKSFANLSMASVPVTMIRTREPDEVVRTLREFAFAEKDGEGNRYMSFAVWDAFHGWCHYDKDNPTHAPEEDRTTIPLISALDALKGDTGNKFKQGVFVLRYPHMNAMMEAPAAVTLIKHHAVACTKVRKRLVMICPPTATLKPEIEDDVVILDFDPPSFAELGRSFDELVKARPEKKRPSFTDEERTQVLSIAAGMTRKEFEDAVALAMVENKHKIKEMTFDDLATVIRRCKTEAVKKTDVLEMMDAVDPAQIGGLGPLKDWMGKRKNSFSDEARAFGIEPPRGILLVGPAGTGKSLFAKATAGMLKLSLVKFDVSRIFQSLVGSSEQRIRSTLKIVDGMAPCVLFLDELDKVFGGAVSGSQGDSGVSQRVLGAILTWLQESKSPVFVVATANRVQFLPPELMRRGRMDEIFSVQMPSPQERRQILDIHIKKRRHDPTKVHDLEAAVAASEGYVGAEIEAAVKDALIEAFDKDGKNGALTGELIAQQLVNQKPMSEAFRDDFQQMAEWAHNNARPANEGEVMMPADVPVRKRTRSRAVEEGSRSLDALDG